MKRSLTYIPAVSRHKTVTGPAVEDDVSTRTIDGASVADYDYFRLLLLQLPDYLCDVLASPAGNYGVNHTTP